MATEKELEAEFDAALDEAEGIEPLDIKGVEEEEDDLAVAVAEEIPEILPPETPTRTPVDAIQLEPSVDPETEPHPMKKWKRVGLGEPLPASKQTEAQLEKEMEWEMLPTITPEQKKDMLEAPSEEELEKRFDNEIEKENFLTEDRTKTIKDMANVLVGKGDSDRSWYDQIKGISAKARQETRGALKEDILSVVDWYNHRRPNTAEIDGQTYRIQREFQTEDLGVLPQEGAFAWVLKQAQKSEQTSAGNIRRLYYQAIGEHMPPIAEEHNTMEYFIKHDLNMPNTPAISLLAFVASVLVDPSTYMTGGASRAAKAAAIKSQVHKPLRRIGKVTATGAVRLTNEGKRLLDAKSLKAFRVENKLSMKEYKQLSARMGMETLQAPINKLKPKILAEWKAEMLAAEDIPLNAGARVAYNDTINRVHADKLLKADINPKKVKYGTPQWEKYEDLRLEAISIANKEFSPENIRAFKQELIDKGGIKIGGKTIVSGERVQEMIRETKIPELLEKAFPFEGDFRKGARFLFTPPVKRIEQAPELFHHMKKQVARFDHASEKIRRHYLDEVFGGLSTKQRKELGKIAKKGRLMSGAQDVDDVLAYMKRQLKDKPHLQKAHEKSLADIKILAEESGLAAKDLEKIYYPLVKPGTKPYLNRDVIPGIRKYVDKPLTDGSIHTIDAAEAYSARRISILAADMEDETFVKSAKLYGKTFKSADSAAKEGYVSIFRNEDAVKNVIKLGSDFPGTTKIRFDDYKNIYIPRAVHEEIGRFFRTPNTTIPGWSKYWSYMKHQLTQGHWMFHIRNKLSGLVMGAEKIGGFALDPLAAKRSRDAIWGRHPNKQFKSSTGEIMTNKSLFDEAVAEGAVDNRAMTTEIGTLTTDRNPKIKSMTRYVGETLAFNMREIKRDVQAASVAGKVKIASKEFFKIPYNIAQQPFNTSSAYNKIMQKLGGNIEDSMRLTMYRHHRIKGAGPKISAEFATSAYLSYAKENYSLLSNLAYDNFIPFGKFTEGMVKNYVKMAIFEPGKFATSIKLFRSIAPNEKEYNMMPEYWKSKLIVKAGDRLWATGISPMENLLEWTHGGISYLMPAGAPWKFMLSKTIGRDLYTGRKNEELTYGNEFRIVFDAISGINEAHLIPTDVLEEIAPGLIPAAYRTEENIKNMLTWLGKDILQLKETKLTLEQRQAAIEQKIANPRGNIKMNPDIRLFLNNITTSRWQTTFARWEKERLKGDGGWMDGVMLAAKMFFGTMPLSLDDDFIRKGIRRYNYKLEKEANKALISAGVFGPGFQVVFPKKSAATTNALAKMNLLKRMFSDRVRSKRPITKADTAEYVNAQKKLGRMLKQVDRNRVSSKPQTEEEMERELNEL